MANLGTVGISADCANLVYHIGFGKTVSGTVYDDVAAPTARTVRIYRRDTGALIAETISDGVTGAYTFNAPNVEVCRVVLDDAAGTLYNDVIDRVLPGP